MKIFKIIFMLMLMNLSIVHAQEPIIFADSAILIEASTGRVIYEKNADVERPPASMTKMMTCILGLEYLQKRTLIPISEIAAYTEDNYFYWTPGDVIQADELMLAMMMESDNGAAVAIAQAISGSTSDFAYLMNKRADELGCTNTNFVTPNGLPNENHYSTARDMAKIAMYGMSVPNFRDIVSMKKAIIHWRSPSEKFSEAQNTNELLGIYDGMTGIKTGWTRAAGGCLAASAMRNNTELIAIIMHSTDNQTRFDDAEKLLNYGFDTVKMTKTINRDRVEKVVFVKNGKKAAVHVRPLDDLNFPLLKDEDPKKLKISYELPKIVNASIKEGQILGKANLKYDGKILTSVPLVSDEKVDEGFSIGSKVVGLMEPVISIAQSVLIAVFA